MINHSAIHGGDFSSLTAINCVRLDTQAERAKAVVDHAEHLKRLDKTLAACAAREALLLADLKLDVIDRARKIISVGCLWERKGTYQGRNWIWYPTDYNKPPVDKRVALLQPAIDDIATAKDVLLREFFGLKDYEGFYHQRSDHPYGYGPRHGSIVFRIGMTEEARKNKGLTLQERDDVIYYLCNQERIQRAEGDTRAVAA